MNINFTQYIFRAKIPLNGKLTTLTSGQTFGQINYISCVDYKIQIIPNIDQNNRLKKCPIG